MLIKHIDIPQKGDERGLLSVAQLGEALPFIVRRVYWIHGTQNGVSRGFHAHKNLKQFFVCVAGSVRMFFTNGFISDTFTLTSFSGGVFVGPRLWREMSDFSPDCVLMVFTDAEYDEADYIRNHTDFMKYAQTD
jgi:dTDP-4-dehydrorhamnose 3,5-epimerase-like enzyme